MTIAKNRRSLGFDKSIPIIRFCRLFFLRPPIMQRTTHNYSLLRYNCTMYSYVQPNYVTLGVAVDYGLVRIA